MAGAQNAIAVVIGPFILLLLSLICVNNAGEGPAQDLTFDNIAHLTQGLRTKWGSGHARKMRPLLDFDVCFGDRFSASFNPTLFYGYLEEVLSGLLATGTVGEQEMRVFFCNL